MEKVKFYAVNCNDAWPMLADDDPSGTYVRYEDYAALEAENVALKSKGRELLNEAGGVYEKYNATINPENGDFMDGQTLHEFQFLMDVETPATDAFLREVRAQGVDMAACALDDVNQYNYANMIDELAQKLRKGGAA